MIHFFLASNLETFDTNKVQLFCFIILSIGLRYTPLAIIILHPDNWQIFAASIFVFIPPLPNSLTPLKLIFFKSLLKFSTFLINLASLNSFGFLVYKPSTSDKRTNVSALIICATRDASLSLSPYLISVVAMVSFSLTIGMKPKSNKFLKVLLAFKDLLRSSVSSRVNKIWEIFNLYFEKVFENKFISSIWPIEATAWLMSNLRFFLL